MPSASAKVPTTQDKDMKLPTDLTEPFKQVVTLVEHKIRNMEKRKLKLDGYKQEQEQGKDLNADQLSAVAKYGELMQSLEFARDLSKQVTQIQIETSRLLKKQTKREQSERLQAEAERTKEIMILTNWLHRLVMLPHVRADFVNGNNPSRITLSTDENQAIDELAAINLANFDMSLNVTPGIVSDHFSSLLDGKDKIIPKTTITYSHMKKLLLSLNSDPYAYEHLKYQLTTKSDSGDADISADSDDITVAVAVSDCAQLPNETGNFNYVQNLIESPDMDPAVVVTSTNAPPQLMTQQLATMQQVIPQSSHLGPQTDFEPKDTNPGSEDAIGDTYNGTANSAAENELGQSQGHLAMQSQGQMETGEMQMQEQGQEWENKTANLEGYGAKSGEIMEGNDFMENNFSTWEGPQSAETNVNNSSGNTRRGGSRYNNSNGHQGHGRGDNRYRNQGGSGNRWNSQGDRGDRGGYDDNRGRGDFHRERDREGDYKPRSGGRGGRGNGTERENRGGGERNYYNSGYRNGTPRGRRPYRGGGGNSQEQPVGVQSGAY